MVYNCSWGMHTVSWSGEKQKSNAYLYMVGHGLIKLPLYLVLSIPLAGKGSSECFKITPFTYFCFIINTWLVWCGTQVLPIMSQPLYLCLPTTSHNLNNQLRYSSLCVPLQYLPFIGLPSPKSLIFVVSTSIFANVSFSPIVSRTCPYLFNYFVHPVYF